ncbi:MAG TPA: amidase [Nocardioides sp.]|nr:amidase [Nocardioides sp.]
MNPRTGSFEWVEAGIAEVLTALRDGRITSAWLTQCYLDRIEAVDRGDGGLNSVPVPNPRAPADAAESDRRWRAGSPRALEGIPYTVKDSYSVEGLTVAAGSPAFAHLVAGRDAFCVEQLRHAGAVLIGKTNMPPMADGGMQRGLYGRPESPYNRDYLPAAYASGSSSGSGVATTANLAMFGLAEETVSSGRSPASNNGLCAYTPSWGLISIRGNWPLHPARDVVVPHTRSVPDLLRVLDVLVRDDPETRGDFWRSQTVVALPTAGDHRPISYFSLADPGALAGKRLAVPRMYLGQDPGMPIAVRRSVLDLWHAARRRLEALGAEIAVTDFPLIERYEQPRRRGEPHVLDRLPPSWRSAEADHFLPYGWDDFLRANADPAYPSLGSVDPEAIAPRPAGTLPDRFDDETDRFVNAVGSARSGIAAPWQRDDFAAGLRALQALRHSLFEDWLDEHGLDAVVFPANADVGAANAESDPVAADRAWSNGVLFSHGNVALRHLGIPTVTVAMGLMADLAMPVGLTFAGAAYADLDLLRYAAAFEAGDGGTLRRPPPDLTPARRG